MTGPEYVPSAEAPISALANDVSGFDLERWISHADLRRKVAALAAGVSVKTEVVREAWGLSTEEIAKVREAAIDGAAWELLDHTMDTADRNPSPDDLATARRDARVLLAGGVPVETARMQAEIADAREWQNTRWWRAIGPGGELWCESSDEDEVRELARPGDQIQYLMQEVPRRRWVDDRAILDTLTDAETPAPINECAPRTGRTSTTTHDERKARDE